MTFSLTPPQFSSICNKLCNMSKIVLKPESLSTGTKSIWSGTIQSPQVLLSYSYNAKDTLTVEVLEKYGLAKLASPKSVHDYIAELLKESTS